MSKTIIETVLESADKLEKLQGEIDRACADPDTAAALQRFQEEREALRLRTDPNNPDTFRHKDQ